MSGIFGRLLARTPNGDRMKTHNQSIKDMLFENLNSPVSLPALSHRTKLECNTQCFVVHSRIAELRKIMKGYEIDNHKDGYKSYYTLRRV
jgi:biotin operon repressor